ncbi:chromate efflux transporter [Methylocapsa sp. S129]|uniref:chromate efflux transporter n=1 Tax=Methylocapsa sp. S129 TaxID=1641869 RepID=UPI001FED6B9F|nr:chromate efflux transporter [Methylocapsa sp. S129]
MRPGSPSEILRVFLKLGLTSFGGPVAHLGYFRAEFVERREWLSESAYADIVALCQFLPGPASSQVAVSLGVLRAGLAGGLTAWCGFTLPSALILILFAYGVDRVGDLSHAHWLHGLKIVATAVVAQAIWAMARNLCPDRQRVTLAVGAAMLVLAAPSALGQVGAIIAGALIGWRFLPAAPAPIAGRLGFGLSRRLALAALALFFALLLLLPLASAASGSHALDLIASFYRSGALVFGGGHVVLPLLQQAVVPPGWIGNDGFLAGYGAAQAVPGPLFTFAAYLGAAMNGSPSGWLGGLICLTAIYLPSFLLLVGVLPFWDSLRQRASVQSALKGVNAAVVGLLLAALYTPVWTSAMGSSTDFAIGLAAFLLLVFWRAPPWLVVILGAATAWALSA